MHKQSFLQQQKNPLPIPQGVRITIHAQDEFPFPDAFGYSAPTHQLSSFGLALVRTILLILTTN
jgi:hypothetical protein